MTFSVFTIFMQLLPWSSPKTFSSLLKETLFPLSSCIPFPSWFSCWQPPVYLMSLRIYLFWIIHINGVMYYVTFCVWLLSLSMFLRFTDIVVCASFLWPNNIPLYICVSLLFICLSVVGLSKKTLMNIWAVSTFWLLWIVLLWICMLRVFAWVPVFSSIGYMSGSGIAESHDNSVFNFLRNH